MQAASTRWGVRLTWLIVILLGAGGAAVYFQQNPEQLPDWAARSELGRDLQTTTVYKWQDSSGAWHISDQKPDNSVDYREEKYSRDANVLPLPPELQQQ
jgi:hypothetical protein